MNALVRVLRMRGSFASQEDLSRKIEQFIEYFNRTMAKAYKWTYKGKPIRAKTASLLLDCGHPTVNCLGGRMLPTAPNPRHRAAMATSNGP